jgi:hypothetical protein
MCGRIFIPEVRFPDSQRLENGIATRCNSIVGRRARLSSRDRRTIAPTRVIAQAAHTLSRLAFFIPN